jgi:hypothetical protein
MSVNPALGGVLSSTTPATPAMRYKNTAICARVTSSAGPYVVGVVPVVTV